MSFIEEVKAIWNFKRGLVPYVVGPFVLGLVLATIAS